MKSKKGLYIALGLSGALLVLIIILCIVIGNRVKEEVTNPTPAIKTEVTTVPQITQTEAEPTKTSEVLKATNTPSSTPTTAATSTPTTAPTDTPVPTATDTPVPTATPVVVAPLTGTEVVFPEKDPNRGPRVIIDPGHGNYLPGGAFDGGTHGDRKERKEDGSRWWESEITYEIALFVKQQLEADGVEVLLTRDSDSCVGDKYGRLDYSNSLDVDCYVSIHLNSATASVSGTEVFINSKINKASGKLATYVLNELLAKNGSRNRQVKVDNELVVLNTRHPSCLVECEFMSSDEKFPLLITPEYQELTATGITNGIIKFLDYLDATE